MATITITKSRFRLAVAQAHPPSGQPAAESQSRILIAGIGNLLLRDDGVGVHAVRALRSQVPAGVAVAEIGTAILHSLHLLETAEKILVIDAMQAGGAPGTIYAGRVEDLEETPAAVSMHQLGLTSAFRFLPNHRRPKIVVLGVEPEQMAYGMELTPAVAAALPRVVDEAKTMIARWAALTESAPSQPHLGVTLASATASLAHRVGSSVQRLRTASKPLLQACRIGAA